MKSSEAPKKKKVRLAVAVFIGGFLALLPLAAVGQSSEDGAQEAGSGEAVEGSATEQPPDSSPSETTPPATSPPETAPPATSPPATGAPAANPGTDQSETQAPPASTSTTLSAEQQQEKARAVANLNLARAADQEINNRLRSITDEANQTIRKIEEAREQIRRSEEITKLAASELAANGQDKAEIEESLRVQAVEGYKTRSLDASSLLFANLPVNEALRQDQLLDQANASTTDLLAELRLLVADSEAATAQAERAAAEAQRAEELLQLELSKQEDQLLGQQALKSEAERRVDAWAGELTAYAQEDAGIQEIIGSRSETVSTALDSPKVPSQLGFQWPLDARVTSEYGYRIHPVYGTRRLHAGLDIAAPRGTPIAASNDGVVIFAGVRGGYGRTVIVDHGAGVTTLYAHMTDFNVGEGASVDRGNIVGFVGATGTATGNHLHFEVRQNSGAVNPRSYLP